MYTLSARGVVCIRRRRGVWCVYIVSEGCGVYTLSARGVVCRHCQRGVWSVYSIQIAAKNLLVCTGLPVESEEIYVCVAAECRWMHMDRERGKGRGRRGRV